MKLALVFMFTNELPWLKLHLPVFKDQFDGIVAITDPKTTDGSLDYMHSIGADVIVEDWRYDWGAFATKAFNRAEALGYDAAMRVDPDECLMPDAGDNIRSLLENLATLLIFPRHEFYGDRLHVRGNVYPDPQVRAWRLRRGIVVGGEKHEGVDLARHGLSEHTLDADFRALRVESSLESDLHIFHYGWSSPTAIWNAMTKYQSMAQVAAGGPPEVNFPANHPLAYHPTVPFDGPQPLNPAIVGKFAPFKEK